MSTPVGSGEPGLGRAFVVSSLGRAGTAVLSLAAVLLATRVLSPAAYGHLALLLAASSIAYALVSAWSVTPTYLLASAELVAFGSMRRTALARLRMTGWAGLIVCTAAALAVTLFASWREVSALWLAAWIAATIGAILVEQVTTLFESSKRIGTAAVIQVVRPTLYAAALVAILVSAGGDPLGSVLWALVITWLVALLFAAALITRLPLSSSASSSAPTGLWRLSSPLVIHAAAQTLFGAIDVYLVQAFRDAHDVGLYGLAYQGFAIALTVIASALPVITPRLAATPTPEALSAHIRSVGAVVLPWLAACACVAAPLTPPMVALVFGDRYAGTAAPLSVLVIALVLLAAATILSPVLSVDRRMGWITSVAVAGVSLNLGLDLLFLGPLDLGIQAPAWATVAAGGLTWVLYNVAVGRHFDTNVPWRWVWVWPVVASTLATLLIPSAIAVPVGIVLGVSVFVAASRSSRGGLLRSASGRGDRRR